MAAIHGKNYGNPTLDLNFAGNKSLVDSTTGTNYVTFSRAQSGNEATYVGSDGLIKYAAADEARFDHDPVTGESLGLLIEESRTNELTYSVITNANWGVVDGATITDNQATAPDGTNTAALINFPAVGVPRIFITTSIASGTRMVSCWIKAKTGTVTVRVGNGSDFGINQVVGTEWTRITEQVPSSSNSAGIYCSNPVSGAEFYAWGAQLEAGSSRSSYIPTSGSTVTRSADVASITGTNFSSWYNQSEGTVYSEFDWNFNNQSNYTFPWNILYDGGNGVYLGNWGSTTRQSLGVRFNSPGLTSQLNIPGSTPGVSHKYATTLNAFDFAVALDGGFTGTYTGSDLATSMTSLWMGGFEGTYVINGHISRLTYYPKRLPDIELQQLTK